MGGKGPVGDESASFICGPSTAESISGYLGHERNLVYALSTLIIETKERHGIKISDRDRVGLVGFIGNEFARFLQWQKLVIMLHWR